MLVRHRVTHPVHADGGVPADPAGLPERHRDRLLGQHVQPAVFLGEQVDRCPAGDPVRPPVHLSAERGARGLQLTERRVLLEQVRLRRHQVGLGHPHRRLRATLGLRIRRHTRADGHPVVPPGRHHVRMPDRHPCDMLNRHGLLVVGQRVRRCAAKPPQCRVQAAQQRRQGAIPRRQHHPEPRPGQPPAEQHRAAAINSRAVAPVELQPQPGFRYPGPEHPAVPGPPRLPGPRDRPPRRPLRPEKTHRHELLVRHVRADPALGLIHRLLELRQKLIDQHRPLQPLIRRHPASRNAT